MGRTIIDATPTVDPWPIIDLWAEHWRYELRSQGPSGRMYRHGDGFAVGAILLQIDALPHALRLTAWVPNPLGGDLDLDGGGYLGSYPRALGHDHLNELLRRLGVAELPR